MPKNLDKCVIDIKKKIKSGEIKKTYKCDSKGNKNSRGKHKCKSEPWAICKRKMK
jgi:hypothetical protein